MKVRSIILKDIAVEEVNGEFQQVIKNEKKYPAFLTNYAMQKGRDSGLLDSSLFSELLKLHSVVGSQESDDLDPSVIGQFDESNAQKVIYVAFIGANPSNKMSYEEFLRKYHEPLPKSIELYSELISDLMDQDPNQFAKALEKSKGPNKNQKKSNRRR